MADIDINGLTELTSVDRAADYIEIADASDANNSKRSSVNSLLDLTSHPVGETETQTLTNKTLTAPAVSSPVLSGTVTGTYTLGGTPTFPSSVVTLTGSQTLTNKVLTSPTINAPTITNPTLTTDTVNEFTSAAGVTIDGLLIKDSKLATANSVVTTNITADAVTATKIDWASTGADGGIWWEELGRSTLSVAGDTITISSIPARKYIVIISSLYATGGTINARMRFNNDTGANYSERSSINGAADGTATSQTTFGIGASASTNDRLSTLYVINTATKEKLVVGHVVELGAAGAGTAPTKGELTNKWANTADQVTRIDVTNTGTGDFAIGSEVLVLGHN